MSPINFSELIDDLPEGLPLAQPTNRLSRSVRLSRFRTTDDTTNATTQPTNNVTTAPSKLGKKAPTVLVVCLMKFSVPAVEKFGVTTVGAAA